VGQGLGTIFGLITAFAITFVVMTFGSYMPRDLISPDIVQSFLSSSDLEIRLAVIGTILYPPALNLAGLSSVLTYGATGASVLMFLAWGTGGLVAGLMSKDFLPAIMSAVFAAIVGAFLVWLLVFAIQISDIMRIFDTGSLLFLELAIQGAIYPCIACAIGGVLGGGITRDR
jgi:hypothetical protein